MKKQYIRPYGRALSVMLAASFICVTLAGCGQTDEVEETTSEVIPVQVQAPAADTLTLQNEFMGTLSPEDSVYVISKVSAEVLSTEVSVGDTVTAGQVLCRLDSEPAELQLASAQAQYNSAAAGLNSAEVGYKIAESNYASASAQVDASLGGQKDLQLYQLQMNIDSVQNGIDDIKEQQDDLKDNKKDAKDARKDLKNAADAANANLKTAQENYENAQKAVAALEPGDYDALQKILKEQYGTVETDAEGNTVYDEEGNPKIVSIDQAKYDYDLAQAKANLETAKSAYEQAASTASSMSSAYEQAKSSVDTIEDGQDDLDEALKDAYDSLSDVQNIYNITADEVYGDAAKTGEASKNTAALSMDSAQASINSAKRGMESAQVGIDSAEYQLDMYTLTAPIDGVIEAANVNVHDFATSSSPAFIISNKDTMTVTFNVSENIRNVLKTGQKIQADRNGALYEAVITEIGSMIDQSSGLFKIKASVSDPDDNLLTGTSVKITADTYSQEGALLIPYDAVYYDENQAYVYVAEGNVAKRKDIETGIFNEDTITVLSGLTAMDKVITSWSENLRDGVEISIQSDENSITSDTESGETEASPTETNDTGETQNTASAAVK